MSTEKKKEQQLLEDVTAQPAVQSSYSTAGLNSRKEVENALANAEYAPGQSVTNAAADLKNWQQNRPGKYESTYQGRIEDLIGQLLERNSFQYSYAQDPLYRQYAQQYTQNARNASADAAAQAAALTGGYGSSYAASVAQQAYQQQMGALKTRITIEDFMASLTAEYYNYIQQTLRLENFRYAVSLSRERLRITEARVQVGNFSRLDLLQARVDFNADSSKYMSQHELVTASRIRINELLANENLDERFSIPDSVIRVNATLDWNDLLAKTLSANASLLMAEHNSSLAELDLKTVLARNYPYVNLTTGYGYTYNRYGTGGNLSRGTLGLNAGVKVGFTIFDGNRRREQRNARIDVENAQLTRERLEQSLRANLSNFWQAYRNNLEVILLEEENLIAAKENYEIAMERYLLGDLPGIEMREAQKSLLDAEERILTAQYNTKLCEISLQQISGNVMVYLE